MSARVADYLSGLPLFVAYFALGLLLLGLFVAVYVRFTPYREIELIRQGNTAAAVSLGGAMLGFVLPLASVIENSVSLLDMLVWSLVALVVQVLALAGARLLIPGLVRHVEQGQLASGVFLSVLAVALGLLNAACMTY